MARYQVQDGTIVDTDKASRSWKQKTCYNGKDAYGVQTRSSCHSQTLYRSSSGRYYLVHESCRTGTVPEAELIGNLVAARWLTLNESVLPRELLKLVQDPVD